MEQTAEHRSIPRRPTLKGGTIVFNNKRSTISCQVRNLSDTGAKLKLDTTIGVPDAFELLLSDTVRRPCRVVWRTGRELGIQFAQG